MESLKIILAGKEFAVQPLTLGQIEELSVAVVLPDVPDPQENIRRSYERTLGVLVAAMRKDHPDLTAAAMRDMPITRVELNEAHAAVLRFSGLVLKEPEPGEVAPAIQPA